MASAASLSLVTGEHYLKLLQSAGTITSIPDIASVAQSALTILEIAQIVRRNREDWVALGKSCCLVAAVFVSRAKFQGEGQSDVEQADLVSVQQNVKQLLQQLKLTESLVRRYSTRRNWVERTPNYNADKEALRKCQDGLRQVLDLFILQSSLELRKQTALSKSSSTEYSPFAQQRNSDLLALRERSLKGAELHCAERSPPPRCHSGTRGDLRGKIHTWLADENREQVMLWLLGPAGVGKSAIAQTIGESAEELGVFGAAIFFSRSRKVDDTSLLVTSIAYQLAAHHASYRKLVIDAINEDPGIVTSLDKRAQLEKLLVQPWSALKHGGGQSNKLLIIIDGLDECRGQTEQLDLIRLIVEVAKAPDYLPFLWMICSRTEHHLKEIFRTDTLSDVCTPVELLPQESGAQDDITEYLLYGLESIAEQYNTPDSSETTFSLTKDSKELGKLTDAASGVFAVASSMLAFIGDKRIANPASQLRRVLNFIDGSPTDCDGNHFLAPFDRLYQGVLRELENDQLPHTLKILGACAITPKVPALHLANLLGISRKEFYGALQTLHAFLSVPYHTTACQESLHFFHASFSDFLTHHDRSQQYFQDPDLQRAELAQTCLHVLNSTSIAFLSNLSWLPSEPVQGEDDNETPSALAVSYDILGFATTHIWDICTQVSCPGQGFLLKIAAFDFRRLQPASEVIPVREFVRFVRWIYALGKALPQLTNIVRTRTLDAVDEQLLKKCGSISKPLNLESVVEADELEKSPRHILAGFQMETAAVIFVPETVMIYSIDDIDNI